MRQILWAIFLLFSISCTQVDPKIKEAYIAEQIRLRITEEAENSRIACELEALEAAEALIDSIYQKNPLRLLNDSIAIPPKPTRPR